MPSFKANSSPGAAFDAVQLDGLLAAADARKNDSDFVISRSAYGPAPFNFKRHIQEAYDGKEKAEESVPAIAFAALMKDTTQVGNTKSYPVTIYCADPDDSGKPRFYIKCNDQYTAGGVSHAQDEDRHFAQQLRSDVTSFDTLFGYHQAVTPGFDHEPGKSLRGVWKGSIGDSPAADRESQARGLLTSLRDTDVMQHPHLAISAAVRERVQNQTEGGYLKYLAAQMEHDLGFLKKKHNDLSHNLIVDPDLVMGSLDNVIVPGAKAATTHDPFIVFEAQSPVHKRALYYLDPRDQQRFKPILMFQGGHGSGKSTLTRQLSKLYRQSGGESHFIGCSSDTNLEDLSGRYLPSIDAQGHRSSHWAYGPLGQAMRQASMGKPVVVVMDEFNSIPGREQDDFKSFLGFDRQKGSYTLTTGRKVRDPSTGMLQPEILTAPATNLAFALTSNSGLGYQASQGDDALIERQTRVQMDYNPAFAAASLTQLATNRGMNPQVVDRLMDIEKALSKNPPEGDWRLDVGMRMLVRSVQLAKNEEEVPRIFAMHADSIANRTDRGEVNPTQRKDVLHTIGSVFKVDPTALSQDLPITDPALKAAAKKGPIHYQVAALLDRSPDQPRPFFLLEGAGGGGKSTVASDIGEAYQASGGAYFKAQGSSKTTFESLVGQYEMFVDEQGHKSFAWADGPISQAFRSAGDGKKTVLNIEEMAAIPPRVLANLKSPLGVNDLDKTFELRTGRILDAVTPGGDRQEEILSAPAHLLTVIATANPNGDAVFGDKAFVDRFMTLGVPANRVIVEKAVSAAVERRGFPSHETKNVMAFFDQIEKLQKRSITREGQFARRPSARTLGDVVDFAKQPQDIPYLLSDKIATWAMEDEHGRPLPDQRKSMVNVINTIYGSSIIP